jgi:hypothetical protein
MADPFKKQPIVCNTCRFYEATESVCKRYAPRPGQPGRVYYPIVDDDDWCGEWEFDIETFGGQP